MEPIFDIFLAEEAVFSASGNHFRFFLPETVFSASGNHYTKNCFFWQKDRKWFPLYEKIASSRKNKIENEFH